MHQKQKQHDIMKKNITLSTGKRVEVTIRWNTDGAGKCEIDTNVELTQEEADELVEKI